MKKFKILVINNEFEGVDSWRVITPHLTLDDENIECDIRALNDATLPIFHEGFLSQYKIIFFNKVLPFVNDPMFNVFFDTCKRLGIKLVYDIDDYWKLDQTHLNYKNWKENNSEEVVLKHIKKVDWVVTTTPLFAKDISEYNKNVVVLPNAVNLKEMQWDYRNKLSRVNDKIRILWGGGISHMPDLQLLKNEFKKFDKDFLNKTQLFLCGYDLRIRMQDGSITQDNPKRSLWTHFECIFTNDYKWVDNPEYQSFLFQYDNTNFGRNEKFIDMYYQRRHTKSISEFGSMYWEADVCLAPLKNKHEFNYRKSSLKIAEAGAHKCPIIMSNYGPYTLDDIEGKIDGKPKGFLIDENKSNWYEKMKWFSENPNAVIDYGENLYEYVKANYSTDVVGKNRADFYKSIVE